MVEAIQKAFEHVSTTGNATIAKTTPGTCEQYVGLIKKLEPIVELVTEPCLVSPKTAEDVRFVPGCRKNGKNCGIVQLVKAML